MWPSQSAILLLQKLPVLLLNIRLDARLLWHFSLSIFRHLLPVVMGEL